MKRTLYLVFLALGPVLGLLRCAALVWGLDPLDGFAVSPVWTVLFAAMLLLAAAGAAGLASLTEPRIRPPAPDEAPIPALLAFFSAALVLLTAVQNLLDRTTAPSIFPRSPYPLLAGLLGLTAAVCLAALAVLGLLRRATHELTGLLLLPLTLWCGVHALFRFIYYIADPLRQETILLIAFFLLPFSASICMAKVRAGFGGPRLAVFSALLAYAVAWTAALPQIVLPFFSAVPAYLQRLPLGSCDTCYLVLAMLFTAQAARVLMAPAAPPPPAPEEGGADAHA